MSTHTLQTDGVRIVYDIAGEGPPVLLLHGGTTDSTWWGELLPALKQNHTVITMDSRGHGRSSFDERPITYHVMANDTLALLDHLGIASADIVGWSDGAIIAIDIALRQPERLRRVVAYGANFDQSGYRTGDADAPPGLGFQIFQNEYPRRYQEQSPHPDRWDELGIVMHQLYSVEPHWTHDQMHTIQTPILVLDGLDEEVIDIEHSRLLADLLPNGTLELMPGTGHFAMIDQPAEFARIVVDYLDASDPAEALQP
jgi:pimeloyl-ACP methyl ester carboxylesterase